MIEAERIATLQSVRDGLASEAEKHRAKAAALEEKIEALDWTIGHPPTVKIPAAWKPINGADFGKRIRQICHTHGVAIAKLARDCELHENTIANIEFGKHSPQHETIQRLLKALAKISPTDTAALLRECRK